MPVRAIHLGGGSRQRARVDALEEHGVGPELRTLLTLLGALHVPRGPARRALHREIGNVYYGHEQEKSELESPTRLSQKPKRNPNP